MTDICAPAPVFPRDCAVEAKPCPVVDFAAGNSDLHFDGRCLTKKSVRSVPDGWYARVRLVEGQVVEAKRADGTVVTIESPCLNDPTPSDPSDDADSDPCNLTSINPLGLLLTKLRYGDDGQYIQLSGCGTAAAPFKLLLQGSALRSDILGKRGVTFSHCGITVVKGVVTQFVPPITSVSSEVDNIVVTRTGCAVTLRTADVTDTVVYTRLACKMVGTQPMLRAHVQVVITATGSARVRAIPLTAADAAGLPATGAGVGFATVKEAIAYVDATFPGC